MQTSRIIDLSEWAEDDFSRQCARAGVTRNKSRQDRTGWDYLVEFGATAVGGVPADLQPVGMSARVQVKSKEKGRPFVDLKLSNALRFAKEPTPCFLVLYQATEGGEPVRIFARHFWSDEIAITLKRARKADQEGRTDLHKLTVRCAFTEQDEHTYDLVAWLEAAVAGRMRYAEEKMVLVATVGFEDGAIHGNLSFAVEDLQALIDHQIGLSEAAPTVAITLVQRRFGIDAQIPLFSGTPDVAHLRSHPHPARVRVRPQDGADIWLDGELFLPAIHAPQEVMKLRVVADFLEIVVDGKNRGQVTLNHDPDRQRGLASHRALIEVTRTAAAGPLKLLVTCEGYPNIPAEVSLADVSEEDALQQFSNVIACLEKASTGILPPGLAVSQREIDIAWNAIVDFNGMVAGTDFNGAFELAQAPVERVSAPTAAFFFDYVEIGDWVFGAVVRREVERFSLEGRTGKIAFGPARVVEALARRASGQDILGELYGLYRQAFLPEKKTALELCGGSYRGLLALSGNRAAAATNI
ncbi:hypothetical protein [Sphingomonas sp. 8AM]|uniref:hypothetical protein n=1 Tax=Sphingomonas sp. 8AM TaxID=2653170 RepID=UPI0012F284B9|nr:hypothetical protein [Sphingomonas sp. 8AM]VXC80694.1 conserved hypothetical protein [Sphingomonas sp. 8AM]